MDICGEENMEKTKFLKQIKGNLIVSCQALEDEPLHGSCIMAKMAFAATIGGAAAIRANGYQDIIAIKQETNLPIIGLVKRDYPDSSIYITPTQKEIDELLKANADMIAIDATHRKRPNGEEIQRLINYIKKHDKLVMADISTVEEGLAAVELGADCISTTLSGYTEETQRLSTGPDLELVKALCQKTEVPVIAEGRIKSPQEALVLLKNGAHSVVVGSAITRPQNITESFTEVLKTI
ncbi:N-acetylmannosamine-6-phosphate 2-epimerase [Virgibacillus litoralis]|nr:N-acetylmannosamine-6-phosphate 2-epimerase [Virgibacillus litoralis]